MNLSKVPSLSVSAGSIKKCRDSFTIPMDLIIEIFLRLPVKSAARCRCLSKLWAKVLRSKYFIDLFAAQSSARPKILFAHPNKYNLSFFSADQPSQNSSDNIALTDFTQGPVSSMVISVPINGLVCLTSQYAWLPVIIYNPSTRECLTLPKRKEETWRYQFKTFLGYDPTKKQFKVLSLTMNTTVTKNYLECEVLTLETEERSWKMIECCKTHRPVVDKEICINGVLYYRALDASNVEVIVCFDVRYETFRFMNVMETFNKYLPWTTILTNYGDKLGVLINQESNPEGDNPITSDSIAFELWFLKDAEKHEWLKRVYVLPTVWKNVVGETNLIFVGMMGTNEIVLSRNWYCHSEYEIVPLYIFYYNIEKNIIRKLNIQGMKESKFDQPVISLNHVESLFKLRN